jgi:hypothetical protein
MRKWEYCSLSIAENHKSCKFTVFSSSGAMSEQLITKEIRKLIKNRKINAWDVFSERVHSLGSENWELVGTLPRTAVGTLEETVFFFKRPLAE